MIRLNMIERFAENGVVASERHERLQSMRAQQIEMKKETMGLIGKILHMYLIRKLRDVRPMYEWQRHSPSRMTRFRVETEVEGVFNVHDTWRGWSAHLAAKKLLDPWFKVSSWAELIIIIIIIISLIYCAKTGFVTH